ncbi:MAG: hypothetical protein U0570_06335 [Phycisphaerales bacterium]
MPDLLFLVGLASLLAGISVLTMTRALQKADTRATLWAVAFLDYVPKQELEKRRNGIASLPYDEQLRVMRNELGVDATERAGSAIALAAAALALAGIFNILLGISARSSQASRSLTAGSLPASRGLSPPFDGRRLLVLIAVISLGLAGFVGYQCLVGGAGLMAFCEDQAQIVQTIDPNKWSELFAKTPIPTRDSLSRSAEMYAGNRFLTLILLVPALLVAQAVLCGIFFIARSDPMKPTGE